MDAQPVGQASRGFIALTAVLVVLTAGAVAKLAIDRERDRAPLTVPATLGGAPRIDDPPVAGRTGLGGVTELGRLGRPAFAGTKDGRAAVIAFYAAAGTRPGRGVTMLSAVRGRVDAQSEFRRLLADFGGPAAPVQRTIGRTRCGIANGDRGTVCLRTGDRLSVFVFAFEATDAEATAALAEEAHAAMR